MFMNDKTILIVEDEPSVINSLTDKLSIAGYSTITAENGEIALVKALDEKPDLILLDLILPKVDGLTFLKKLRENPWGKYAKVIILTNLSDSEKIEEAQSRNVFDYLIKTAWSLDDVLNKVNEYLSS